MSSIRKQSIFSTLIIYGGFFIGLINTYLFTRKGFFSEEQFGLYNVFIAIAILLAAFGNLGAPYFIYKFFPYYQSRYKENKNDQLTLAILLAGVGFLLILLGGQVFEPIIIRKYSTNSALLVQYFSWVYPLAGGLLLFNILESWSWQQHLSVKSNLLKEGVWRFYILLIILAYIFQPAASFRYFVIALACSYPLIALLLGGYLLLKKKLPLTTHFSVLTKRLKKPILQYSSFTYLGTLIFVIAQVFDSILISSVLNHALAQLAIYSLAQNMASILQAPQRGIIAAAMEPLSRAWKEKDRFTLNKIYQRSSINLLLFSTAIFGLILINYESAITTLDLKPSFLTGFSIFLLLGAARIIDLGTGVNAQLIVTSPGWRFEFYSGIILLGCMLPLSYWLTKKMGITGTALAQLISISIYNSCRLLFLWLRFRLQPFSQATLRVFVFSLVLIAATYYLGGTSPGWTGMIARSSAYLICWAFGVWFFKLTPDLQPVLQTMQQRWRTRKYFH